MIDEKKLIEDIDAEIKCMNEEKERYFKAGNFHNGNIIVEQISAINIIKKIIKNQPEIGRWIPCGERLPEDGQKVIVSKDGKTLDELFEFELSKPDCGDDELIGFLSGFYLDDIVILEENKNTIAWQPLPDSWKGEQNDCL